MLPPCLIEDESLRAETLKLVAELRDAGCAVDYSFTPQKPDKQFKRALELGAARTAKLERTGDALLSVRVKNLRTRAEQIYSADKAAREIVEASTER